MSIQPKISVVIPCYNVEDTLEMAVNSVIAQTHIDFEVVLVDDGSTDDTSEICRNFVDSRVRVVSKSNGGLASARNAGMASARGEYIALLDADDLFEPTKLAEHVAHLDANADVGISFSHSRFITHDGKPLALLQNGQVSGITAEKVLCRNPIGNGSAAVIRRSALADVIPPVGSATNVVAEKHYFDPELRQSEDVEFWLRFVVSSGWRIEGVAKPLTLYRLNNVGLSADTQSQLATWECFIDKAKSYAPNIISDFASLARGFQYRYLARRSVQTSQPVAAIRFLKMSMQEDVRVLTHEPIKTLITMAAAFASLLVEPFRWLNVKLRRSTVDIAV